MMISFRTFVPLALLLIACRGSSKSPEPEPAEYKPSDYEPGYTPGTVEECASLRAALFEDSATIIASQPPATFADPRLPLEAGLNNRLRVFLDRQCYKLPGWSGEDGIHLTGTPTQGATHGWVRVWYSPEVSAWLQRGRPEGEVPAQAIIIKETFRPIGEAKEEGGVFKLVAWQPMIRRPLDSRDGWFWSDIAQDEVRHGVVSCSRPPLAWNSADTLRLDNCRPFNGFGYQVCLRCHASQRDFTFAQTTHLPASTGGGRALTQTIYDYRRVWRDADAQNPDNHYDDYKNAPASTYIAPHPDRDAIHPALGSANPDFVAQYGLPADESAPFEDIPRFFDHVYPKAGHGKPDTFLTSDQCWGCHSGVAHVAQGLDGAGSMLARDGELAPGKPRYADVSPYGEWSVSMMGLAGRDPIFRAQREWEADHRSACADETTDLCYSCHGAAGQRQLHMDAPSRKFDHAMISALSDSPDAKYGELARDGITCSVCHQMSGENLGTPASYTGNWIPTAADDVIGPFSTDVRADPMKRALGKTPSGEGGRDQVVKSSALCGSCHVVRLPVRKVGSCINERFVYEQATFLEWRNSSYRKNDAFISDEGHDGATPQSCQDCHMPRSFAGSPLKKKIASIEDADYPTASIEGVPDVHANVDLVEREPFSRHQLNGINLFGLSMFAQAPRVFGLADYDYISNQHGEPTRLQMMTALLGGRALADASAAVELGEPTVIGDHLEFTVKVTNKAGHKLPSGVAFRRAFLEVSVEDAAGKTLWASGRTNGAGAIVGGDGQVLASEMDLLTPEPHHQVITRENEVQIYEERIADSDGKLTTSFLGLYQPVKDNRLLPTGWKSNFAPLLEGGKLPDGLAPHGVDGDSEYPDDGSAACGCDVVTYKVPLSVITSHARLRARLHYQAIPPYYLRDRFSVPLPDAQRLYQITSHLDTTSPSSFIPGWNLPLTEAVRASR
ncbi:hypothetical protein [Melittangium boletus]|uniref:Cytochrome c family protein n=1 Tax=Melittangium boletus DSM 14713 TaxID=1294270 RepID=A0A250IMQ2_9BACT|nr:hypothetical protein [Melittangium boletus]ATB32447.1 hypothetical protein MEBOL_005925 [Melittangium boletus DSM 14713]